MEDHDSDDENLHQQITNLKKKNKKLASENEKLIQKLEQEKEKNKELKDECDKYQQNLKVLEEENCTIKDKYNNLKLKNKDLKDKMSKSLLSLKRLEEEKKNSESKKSNSKQAQTNQYDIILNIDSLIASNTDGWEIAIKDENKIKKCFEKEQIALGVIGRENVGKTYIINKICNENFPSGFYTSTKGVSIKYCDEEKKQLKVLLDSAGMNGAIFFYSREDFDKFYKKKNEKINKTEFAKIKEKMINDRCMTEYFIQNFILFSCNIIIIIVELLTQHDQKIIERIRNLYSTKKTIVIIHNLFKLELKSQVLERAEYEIVGSFPVVRQDIPDSNIPFYIEKGDNPKSKNIIHIILGKDGCQSGDYFNEISLKHLMKIIETEADISKFNLLNKLNEYWSEKNTIYFNTFREETEIPKFEQKKDEKLNKKYYKLNSNKELELKIPEFNVLGSLRELDITYHLYIINNPKREKLYFFELPGCIQKPDIILKKLTKENEQVLTLNIKNGVNYPENYKCIEGGLSVGTFVKKIKINDEFGDYTCDKGFTTLENGILQMRFALREEEEL